MQRPIEIQRFISSTLKLIGLTACVAAVCWIAYGFVPAIRIFGGITGVILLAQIWAFRADFAAYLGNLFRR